MSEPENNPHSFDNRLFEIGILVVLVVVGAAAFLSYKDVFFRPRSSSGNACINNLRQIDAAANQFALEKGKTNGEAIRFPDDLTPYIKLTTAGKIPGCNSGGTYHIGKVGETPTCSLGSTVTPAHIMP